jgi:hypothetical protein
VAEAKKQTGREKKERESLGKEGMDRAEKYNVSVGIAAFC